MTLQRRDLHELLHLSEIFKALARIVTADLRETFEICELGCTTGWLSNELTAIGQVTGVDPDAERIAQARQHYPGVAFEAGDLLAWAPQRQFDLVVSSEVLEHLSEKRRYVEVLKRLTKPGGWILVTTPNQKLKPHWDAAAMGEGLYEDWLTPHQLRELFADCAVVQHSTFLYDFAYTGVYRWLNAKKLRAVLTACKVDPLYDAARQMLAHGLYQLLLCRAK
jgi:2-polyprenyl-3-methyl-5-hydroxy-6-metoxy-1,4-benzoquinol methylase